MINTEKSLDIHDYTEVFLRRVWYFLIPFVVVQKVLSSLTRSESHFHPPFFSRRLGVHYTYNE
jgi:hypothetical protein